MTSSDDWAWRPKPDRSKPCAYCGAPVSPTALDPRDEADGQWLDAEGEPACKARGLDAWRGHDVVEGRPLSLGPGLE